MKINETLEWEIDQVVWGFFLYEKDIDLAILTLKAPPLSSVSGYHKNATETYPWMGNYVLWISKRGHSTPNPVRTNSSFSVTSTWYSGGAPLQNFISIESCETQKPSSNVDPLNSYLMNCSQCRDTLMRLTSWEMRIDSVGSYPSTKVLFSLSCLMTVTPISFFIIHVFVGWANVHRYTRTFQMTLVSTVTVGSIPMVKFISLTTCSWRTHPPNVFTSQFANHRFWKPNPATKRNVKPRLKLKKP